MDNANLKNVTFTERIRKTGASSVIPITKQAKQMGLKVGDDVTVTLGVPSQSDQYDLTLGRMLSNPNAMYRNISYLTPHDKLINGTPIDDFSDIIPEDTKREIVFKLEAMRYINMRMTEYLTQCLTTNYSFYSDIQRSFVVKFNPELDEGFKKSKNYDLYRSAAILELLNVLSEDDSLRYSPLKDVKFVGGEIASALDVVTNVRDIEDESLLKNKIIEFNAWYDEKQVEFEILNFVPVTVYYPSDIINDGKRDCLVQFGVSSWPFEGIARATSEQLAKHFLEISPELKGYVFEITILGPFEKKADSQKLELYLNTAWEMFDHKNDVQKVKAWVKQQSALIRDKYELRSKNESAEPKKNKGSATGE